MNYLIDRRLNGRNKSAVNRERFIRRYKEHVRRAVKGMVAERSITDMAKGGDVKVPAKDISEPGFSYGSGGDWEVVHPGNKEFVRGDKIPRRRCLVGGDGFVRVRVANRRDERASAGWDGPRARTIPDKARHCLT